MKKLLGILVLGLILTGTSYAANESEKAKDFLKRHNKDCWTAKRYASDPLYISDCPLPWRTIVALVLEAGINVYKQEILDVSFISLWDMLRPDLHHQHLVTC